MNKQFSAPFTSQEENTAKAIIQLLRIVSALRDPETGCPWDIEQTHKSLRSYLIEESHEAVEAIDKEDPEELSSELGDVLLQVALHSQLATESSAFNFEDVCNKISKKMIDRHPHVFGDSKISNSKEVLENWEKLKAKESKSNTNDQEEPASFSSKLNSLPKSLPALLIAERIGEKSARWGFDWSNVNEVWLKVKEEINELEEAISALPLSPEEIQSPLEQSNEIMKKGAQRAGEEIGDCLFSLSQIARWLGLSAEDLLRETHQRFINRISLMESEMPNGFFNSTNEEKEKAWLKAKEILKKESSSL